MNTMYEQFRKEVLGGASVNEKLEESVSGIMLRSNMRGIGSIAVTGFILAIFYIVTDYSRHLERINYIQNNLYAIIGLMIVSLYVMGISFWKKTVYFSKFAEVNILIYYLYINLVVLVFSYSYNLRTSAANIPVEYVGISVTSIYLMVFMAVPMYSKLYSAILIIAMFAGALCIHFMPGHEMYDLYKQLLLRAVVAAGYFIFRKKACQKAEREMHIIELNRQLTMDSYVDSLTNVLNRNALNAYVDFLQKDTSVKQVSAILMNVDYFKQYNDYYSHREGDRLLQHIASTVMGVLEKEECYLVRFGGGSFLVLTREQSDEELIDIAQKYRKAVNVQHIPRADEVPMNHVTISLGCAHLSFQQNHELEDCITRADEQLYHCKDIKEHNCVSFQYKIYRDEK